MKALLIKIKGDIDIEAICQIAKREASQILNKKMNRIRVFDIVQSRFGIVAVVGSVGVVTEGK